VFLQRSCCEIITIVSVLVIIVKTL